ncbi:3-dehydrosphinganine reductase [Vermiconidia calcicola]|uniref:3-dehydrosphinganine reductase n=1 Tax=Vermiconidia calcicola TaxID=1690605 RepID=A0ACC3NYD4_9PEZI|nr:3-dehydrosphinganine reductase [Vermiconidia calcicola]
MGFLKGKNQFDVDGRTVLITGGSQGMGRGLAKLLAQKGANVVIVARNEQKLAEALKYIASSAKDPSNQRFHSISADVTKPEENTRIITEVTEWNHGNPPDIVWANAGSAHPSLFIETPLETLRSQMDINYWAATYLAHATLKVWLKPTSGKTNTTEAAKPRHFLITSSVACFAGLTGYSPYSVAKSALRSLADNLRQEINLYNGYRKGHPSKGPSADVKIHCVCPGTILSPGFEHEEQIKHPATKILEEGDPRQTEDEVASAAVKALEKGEYLVTTQFLGHAMKAGMMGGSPRSSPLIETLLTWAASVFWLFEGPKMDRKIFEYGQKNEVKLPE